MPGAVALQYHRRPSVAAYMLRAMSPMARRRGLELQITARWQGHVVDEREHADFVRITGLPDGDHLSILEPHTFGFPLTMALLTHPAFPVPIWGVLQIRNHLVLHRPLPRRAPMDLEARLIAARTFEKGAELDVRTEVTIDGQCAWESVVTFFTRARFAPHGTPAEQVSAPAEVGPLVEQWTMADADHWRFCALTGDYNGVHTFDAWARRFGFARALYHPARVLGQLVARRRAPLEVRRLDAWLKGPVPHGAEVRLHFLERDQAADFALFVERQRPAMLGRLHWDPREESRSVVERAIGTSS